MTEKRRKLDELSRKNEETMEHPTVIHPVNLALLLHTQDPAALWKIHRDTTFSIIPKTAFPEFQIFQHKYAELVAAREESHLTLHRVIDAINNNKVVYRNLAEPILSDFEFDSWLSLLH